MSFQFLCLKMIAKAKSASEAVFLRSRHFLRHQFEWHGVINVSMGTMPISPSTHQQKKLYKEFRTNKTLSLGFCLCLKNNF